MENHTTHSLDETVTLGSAFAERLDTGDCVALEGQLGAGKTQFARGVALGLGLDDGRMVRSPTFVLMQEYPARVPVYHLDAYRLAAPEAELLDLGLEEMLADGVVLLEWAERAESLLPPNAWRVRIGITGETDRSFTISRLDE
jgi:tRNA threonylcarbamoyladenosine biosynthesis protein TsaE